MTDQLIARLTADLAPVRPKSPSGLSAAVTASVIVSMLLLLATLGARPDIASAVTTPILWLKFGYALLLALCGMWAVYVLRSPAARAGRQFGLAALVLAAIGIGAASSLLAAPAGREASLLGSSAFWCPVIIAGLALPTLAVLLAWLRRSAPTRLAWAGAAAGLAAGALGAFVYALHCREDAVPFIALWYSLGILAATLAGAGLGHRVLRW